MARRKKEEDKMSTVGLSAFWPPIWFTTYSDFMTLVMTFFVILACMLILDIDPRLLSLGKKKPGAEDVKQGKLSISVEEKAQVDNLRSLQEQQLTELASASRVEKMGEDINQLILAADLAGFVKVETTKWKVKVVPLVPFLFAPARAVLRPEARDFLDRLAKFFAMNPGQIRIAGHTDDLPVYTAEYRSNWELSCARATAIMRYLVEKHGLDPQRFVAVGYGPYHPLAANDTPQGRAMNRRVEIEITQEPELPQLGEGTGVETAAAGGGGAVSPAK